MYTKQCIIFMELNLLFNIYSYISESPIISPSERAMNSVIPEEVVVSP